MAVLRRQTTLFLVRSRWMRGLIGLWAIALGLVVGGPLTALAQTAATPSGITVVGYGEASALAERATLQLLLSRGDYYGGPPPQPRPGDVPGAEEQALAAPIVQALTAKGIAASAVAVVVSPVLGSSNYGPGGPVVARIDVTLEQAELDTIIDLVSSASVAAAGESLILGQVGVGYEVDDCAALERSARQAAIDDARAHATIQADLLGVSLGEITASSDMPAASTAISAYYGIAIPLNGCSPPSLPINVNGIGLAVTVPTFDPTAKSEVDVYAQVSLTFAIGA